MPATVLTYDRSNSFTTQQYYFDCGPASAQIILNARGQTVAEEDLMRAMGTDEGGTDSIDQVAAGLNQYDGESKYASYWMPSDPATPEQVATMRDYIFRSVLWGRGCVANFVVPANNYPKAVTKADKSLPGADAASPAYGPGQIWHYVSCVGVDPDDDTVLICDPGFQPAEYWVTVASLATYVTPHGIVWASGAPAIAQHKEEPKPAAPPAPEAPQGIPCIIGRGGPKPYTAYSVDDKVSHTAHELSLWLAGRTLRDGLGVITDPTRADTNLGHSINAASLSRVNYTILTRLAAKLGVDLSDIA